jgi:hypothetical protein
MKMLMSLERRLSLFLVLIVVGAIPAVAASQVKTPTALQDNKKAVPASQASASHEDEGTQIFEQNCSRCHNPPEGFSTRISGTIVRHMRVRAALSEHDEQELLRFLNP